MTEPTSMTRRQFVATAALGLAAGTLAQFGPASAEASEPTSRTIPTIVPGSYTTFGPLKQIKAGELNVGYADLGPANGTPVLLLHGWPYDIHSFVDVAPALAAAGYRVLVPYLRGYGTTRFLSDATPRKGQRVYDRQSGGPGIEANTAREGTRMVVTVLLRHRSGPDRLWPIHSRFCQADLGAGVAEMAV
jgi:hypothetical protein